VHDLGLGALSLVDGADAQDQGPIDGYMDPVLELATTTTSTSLVHGVVGEEGSDEELVDEEIVVDPPPARVNRGKDVVAPPPAVTPTVCRFVLPPLVFNRTRHPVVTRP
jgi:hypothetical protein